MCLEFVFYSKENEKLIIIRVTAAAAAHTLRVCTQKTKFAIKKNMCKMCVHFERHEY